MKQIWMEKHIYTDCEQNIVIQPNEERTAIVILVKELDGAECSRLYLNKDEVKKLCKELTASAKEYCS